MKFKKELDDWKRRNDKKEIIEKLDNENNYAPIHYAVLSNNKVVVEHLLGLELKCGNN